MFPQVTRRPNAVYAPQERARGLGFGRNREHWKTRAAKWVFNKLPTAVQSFAATAADLTAVMVLCGIHKLFYPAPQPPRVLPSGRSLYWSLKIIHLLTKFPLFLYTGLMFWWQSVNCLNYWPGGPTCGHLHARIQLGLEQMAWYFANTTSHLVLSNLVLIDNEAFELAPPSGNAHYDHIRKIYHQAIPLLPFFFFSLGLVLLVGTVGYFQPTGSNNDQSPSSYIHIVIIFGLVIIGFLAQQILSGRIKAIRGATLT